MFIKRNLINYKFENKHILQKHIHLNLKTFWGRSIPLSYCLAKNFHHNFIILKILRQFLPKIYVFTCTSCSWYNIRFVSWRFRVRFPPSQTKELKLVFVAPLSNVWHIKGSSRKELVEHLPEQCDWGWCGVDIILLSVPWCDISVRQHCKVTGRHAPEMC